MKFKEFLCVLSACIVMTSFLTPASAAENSDENVISLDDLKWEWVDLSTVECLENSTVSRARAPADGTYSAHTIYTLGQPVSLQANHIVTFNCSYSPLTASLDFGVISSSGRFYYINVKEGSINKPIRISQSGSYSVAIRNNSSQTVRVVGFVDY